MATIDELNRLKAKAEEFRREKERAEGALQQVLGRLKKEFGCNSLEEAEALRKKMEKDVAKAEEEFEESLAEFKRKYEEQLR